MTHAAIAPSAAGRSAFDDTRRIPASRVQGGRGNPAPTRRQPGANPTLDRQPNIRYPTVQTFLPFADFAASARVLDWRRLGKQRVEAWMIHDMLTNPEARWRSWLRHPAVGMWRGYEPALARYFWTMVGEWTGRAGGWPCRPG
jgi:hypothetical protein